MHELVFLVGCCARLERECRISVHHQLGCRVFSCIQVTSVKPQHDGFQKEDLPQLRVPTSRQPLSSSFWDPRFWSLARPTDFCYGDGVWGLDIRHIPLDVPEWIEMLFRREELEYDVPGDETPYRAAPINRFRASWYDLHLLASFWRITETAKSIHTFMKTPGAFSFCKDC